MRALSSAGILRSIKKSLSFLCPDIPKGTNRSPGRKFRTTKGKVIRSAFKNAVHGEVSLSGNSAVLKVKGKTDGQSSATGHVKMVLEDGEWKVDTDKWDLTK